jgi:hypothetical protein
MVRGYADLIAKAERKKSERILEIGKRIGNK